MPEPIILIVDDDPLNRSLFTRMLAHLPYQINTANSGKEALETLRAQMPDLMLLNVFMPLMNGIELLRTIRSEDELKSLKVALLTALPETVKPEDGALADRVLAKPIGKKTLVDGVMVLLAEMGK